MIATAATPGGIDVVCDVPRTLFRTASKAQTTATFRLWSAATGGSQLGVDYGVPTTALAVAKRYTDKFAAVATRKSARINAVIGTDASPVLLPADGKAYLEMQIGTSLFGCDYAATNDAVTRRRLQGVAFARESSHSETCETCTTVSPVAKTYVEVFIPTDINQGPLPYNTGTRVNFSNESKDALGEWDTANQEFTAQSAGLYLVNTTVLFSDTLVDGRTYFLVVSSDNDGPVHTSKGSFFAQAAGDASVSAHVSVVLRLDPGEKIWVTVDHNNNSPTLPSLYWRAYNTNLYITRID